MAYGVPAMVRCDLAQRIRYKGYLLRFHGQYQIDKFLFLAIAFDIKFCKNYFFYVVDILVTYMSLVRSRVNSNTVSTKSLCIYCSFHYVRVISAPAVSQRGKLIYIDGELCHYTKLLLQ